MNKQPIFCWNIIFSVIFIATTSMNYAMETKTQQDIFPLLNLPNEIIYYIALPKTNTYKDIKSQLPIICKLRQLNKELRGMLDTKFIEYQALLENANRYDNDSINTPLLMAIMDNDINGVIHLINNGADIDLPDRLGYMIPLLFAVQNKNINIVCVLLQHGATIYNDKFYCYGYDPFYKAIDGNSLDIAELLIQYGADVNRPNSFHDQTPLQRAAALNLVGAVKFLISHDANTALTNTWGGIARLYTNNPEIIAVLEAHEKSQKESKINDVQ